MLMSGNIKLLCKQSANMYVLILLNQIYHPALRMCLVIDQMLLPQSLLQVYRLKPR